MRQAAKIQQDGLGQRPGGNPLITFVALPSTPLPAQSLGCCDHRRNLTTMSETTIVTSGPLRLWETSLLQSLIPGPRSIRDFLVESFYGFALNLLSGGIRLTNLAKRLQTAMTSGVQRVTMLASR